jgi:hypothetical protein
MAASFEEDDLDIDLDAVDDDLDEDPLAGDVDDDSWRGRKRKRADVLLREREAEAKRLEAELEKEREQSKKLNERVGKLEDVANRLVEDELDDPHDVELAQLQDERKAIQKQWYGLSAQARDERQDEFEARMAENEAKRTDVAVRRALAKQKGGQNPVNYQQAVLRGEYSDVWENQNAMQFADGYWKQEVAKGRDRNSLELRREAMQAARETFKTSTEKGQPHDPATRAKYTGTASTGSGASPNRVTLTAADRMMADARFPDMPEKQRYQRFAQIKKRAQKKD